MFLGRKNFLLHWFGEFIVGRISTVPKHVGVVNNIYITSASVGFHKVKVKFFRYRPEQAPGEPEG